MRGNNGSIRQNLMASAESREFRYLRRAVAKAKGDRERTIKAICRLYNVSNFDHLRACKVAAVSLLSSEGSGSSHSDDVRYPSVDKCTQISGLGILMLGSLSTHRETGRIFYPLLWLPFFSTRGRQTVRPFYCAYTGLCRSPQKERRAWYSSNESRDDSKWMRNCLPGGGAL